MNKLKIKVNNLKKYFHISKTEIVHAVDGLNFEIMDGEILGLVGESGCGKTTTGRTIIRLIEPDYGSIIYKDKDILSLNKGEMMKLRKEMQIIFQDPFSSLDPRKNVQMLISEPLRIHKYGNKKQIYERVLYLMDKVGLTKEMLSKYPHELDGGRCQRIGIARAIALSPGFIVCDEPVSALDVSMQAQILNLLECLSNELDLTYLFISHDLSVVKKLSHKIMVMYLGGIVEVAKSDELFKEPFHPYTEALLSAVLSTNLNHRKKRIILEGDVPTPINLGQGCRFYKRCWKHLPICSESNPSLKELTKGHLVACHLYNN